MKVCVKSAAERERDENADKAGDCQIGGLLAAPSRDQPVVNQQQVNQPGQEREQRLRIAHPRKRYLLGIERSGKNTQGHQRKSESQRSIGEIVANLERRQAIEHALALELAFLDQIQHRSGERDKERY